MIEDDRLSFIRTVSRKFVAKRVILFGSCLNNSEQAIGDIDIAVEGLSKSDYYAISLRELGLRWKKSRHVTQTRYMSG
jgi:predicted nucleotidyltransferase